MGRAATNMTKTYQAERYKNFAIANGFRYGNATTFKRYFTSLTDEQFYDVICVADEKLDHESMVMTCWVVGDIELQKRGKKCIKSF